MNKTKLGALCVCPRSPMALAATDSPGAIRTCAAALLERHSCSYLSPSFPSRRTPVARCTLRHTSRCVVSRAESSSGIAASSVVLSPLVKRCVVRRSNKRPWDRLRKLEYLDAFVQCVVKRSARRSCRRYPINLEYFVTGSARTVLNDLSPN